LNNIPPNNKHKLKKKTEVLGGGTNFPRGFMHVLDMFWLNKQAHDGVTHHSGSRKLSENAIIGPKKRFPQNHLVEKWKIKLDKCFL